MPTSTTNYGLIKPGTDDPILIGQLNDNADAIDAALKENADAIENKPDVDDIPTPSTAAPAMDGTAAAGTSTDYARADHIHPSDTSKQNALSSAQLAAVNSGINSTKVEQIETNKNNILKDEAALVELVDGVAKNIIELGDAICEKNGVTAVLSSDGSIVLSGKAEGVTSNFLIINDLKTGSQTVSYASLIPIKSGIYTISGVSDSRVSLQVLNYNSSSDVDTFDSDEFTATKQYIDFRLIVRRTADFTTPLTIHPMCCTKAAWNISQTYQPYRPSYQELYEMVKALQANQ